MQQTGSGQFSRKRQGVGGIELRTDRSNCGKMKMWLDSSRVLTLLQRKIQVRSKPFPDVFACGQGVDSLGRLQAWHLSTEPLTA